MSRDCVNNLFQVLLVCIFALSMASVQAANLTEIQWDHAVNSQVELSKALTNDKPMIEADIIMGTLTTSGTTTTTITTAALIPVMGHPPANSSNLSLEKFLEEITKHNADDKKKLKGIKLDFKSIEAFTASNAILIKSLPTIKGAVWLNADILKGPVNADGIPVNADQFLTGSLAISNAVLSIGWTTKYGDAKEFPSYGTYTDAQIDEMIKVVNEKKVKHQLTFPVRAGLAAQSLPQLEKLLSNFTENKATLTVWSGNGDNVNAAKLTEVILKIGVDKVYLDVPEEVSKEMKLGGGSSQITALSALGLIAIAIMNTL